MNKRIFVALGLPFLALQAQPAAAMPAAPADLDAQQILARTEQVYHGLKTYQDAGTDVITVQGENKPMRSFSFSTLFERDGRLRFVFDGSTASKSNRYVVLMKDGKTGVQRAFGADVDGKEMSIDMAIAGADGISDGVAFTVPSMLVPAATLGTKWYEQKDARRIEDGQEAGTDCYRIESSWQPSDAQQQVASTTRKATTTYWIAKDSALLLRKDEDFESGNLKTHSTAHYHAIKVDAPIADDAFSFPVN